MIVVWVGASGGLNREAGGGANGSWTGYDGAWPVLFAVVLARLGTKAGWGGRGSVCRGVPLAGWNKMMRWSKKRKSK